MAAVITCSASILDPRRALEIYGFEYEGSYGAVPMRVNVSLVAAPVTLDKVNGLPAEFAEQIRLVASRADWVYLDVDSTFVRQTHHFVHRRVKNGEVSDRTAYQEIEDALALLVEQM